MSYSSIFRFIACLKRNEIFTIGKTPTNPGISSNLPQRNGISLLPLDLLHKKLMPQNLNQIPRANHTMKTGGTITTNLMIHPRISPAVLPKVPLVLTYNSTESRGII